MCFQENSAILKELVQLRAQKSSLLGFTTHADFVLEMNMAKSGKKVAGFLGESWTTNCLNLQHDAEVLMTSHLKPSYLLKKCLEM